MTAVGWCPGGRPVADMLALYPGTTIVRVFVGPGDPLPAWDGPILGPAAGVPVHLSFKDWDLPALSEWLDAMPAGRQLILTYHHEPEQGTDEGDPTPEQFHARWAELVAAVVDQPRWDQVLLVPVYTRYWWQAHPGDLRWLVTAPVDAHGWDIYNNGTAYRTPDDLLSIPRQIAARTGLPYLIAELGAVRVPGDDGSGRTAWMRAMVDAANLDGALTVCWFHRLEWDLTRVDSGPEQQTLRELIQEAAMPSYDQLQAEPYWDREVVTPEMDWLGDELCRRTGRPRVAFGTKGDRYHLRGAHRSQEWIRRSAYCTNRTYTVQDGLTADQDRHIAGADFTPGSAADMIAQSKRLLAAMKAGQLDEVREFYGNVDGDQVVDGWDNLRDRAASSDSSHLWHWHLTIDRRHCRNKQLMERILAIALGDPVEEDFMSALTDAEQRELLTLVRSTRTSANVTAYRVAALISGALEYDNQMGNKAAPNVLAQTLKALGEAVARESSSPEEIRALFAELPQPETADPQEIVDGVLAGLGDRSEADVAQALVAAGQDPAKLRDELAKLAPAES